MMSLFKELTMDEFQQKGTKPLLKITGVTTTRSKITVTNPLIFSTLSEFFLLPHVISEANTTSVPLYNLKVREDAMSHLSPHFEEVIDIKQDDGEGYLSMRFIKESSKSEMLFRLKNNKITPFVSDLYGTEKIEQESPFNKVYSVDIAHISAKSDDEFNFVWEFLRDTYIKNQGFISLSPNNWVFEESFKEKLFVRLIASVCDEMTILVSKDKIITSIIVQ